VQQKRSKTRSPEVAQTGRKSERWCTLGTLCRKLDWPTQRLLYELQNGRVHYRTIPEGYVIDDWLDPYLRPYLNIEASQISIPYGVVVGAIVAPPPKKHLGREEVTFGIEVLLPTDTAEEDPASPPAQRWRKPPAPDDLKIAALAVAKAYQPDDPPTQAGWWEALNAKLGEPVTRKVALRALADWAPQLQRQRGQKRNRRS
jgi:hypothetical protein